MKIKISYPILDRIICVLTTFADWEEKDYLDWCDENELNPDDYKHNNHIYAECVSLIQEIRKETP